VLQDDAARMNDPAFTEFKKMGKDQTWTTEGIFAERYPKGQAKEWTFGYSHDKALATKMGCGGGPDLEAKPETGIWNHVCLFVAKTSPKGTTTDYVHSVHFGKDPKTHTHPTAADIREFITAHGARVVPEAPHNEL
jgi:hypothetical protein